MDGHGDMDIVSTAGWDHSVSWYENDGAANPTWSAADISVDEREYPRVAHLVDIDSDIDILVASGWDHTISRYENDGAENQGFTGNIVDDSADYANALDAADLDGDGDLDIVTDQSGMNSITWYESTLSE